jgi:aminopeptidase N
MAQATELERKAKYRKDYVPSDFQIGKVDLSFNLFDDRAVVDSKILFSRNSESNAVSLQLDGEDLKLLEIRLDGKILQADKYKILENGDLFLEKVPESFELQTVVEIHPHLNTQLSGLYRSGSMFCTQCEAEGFRRITYFLDRPDVMTTYSVRIEADQDVCPVLLSNGNEVGRGECADGRHYVEWHDPFPKPSYLFAVVAGDLGCLQDQFETSSGKNVDLFIYSEHQNVDKLSYAMKALQRSMKWDEDVYGLEYDLNIYNIVAVGDFNMGAMENKSLNIFNTAYVLTSPETATDSDYEGVEGVIGHEYFHNYTGNRITCRDWFQLTLKEGLTVFRDQQFSADMGDSALKRIDDVNVLRSVQFREDQGPTAHPIRPESYVAMDNFYTSTVYNKGAEVIRMMHTLVGEEGFRKGMDLYFERYDGQAVSCDDFRQAIADANEIDLNQFENWYLQAGTPILKISEKYNSETQEFHLYCEQSYKGEAFKSNKPLHIPLRMALFSSSGEPLAEEVVLELRDEEQDFVFKDISSRPVVSILRQFSAPVILEFNQSEEDLVCLILNDTDSFNRWEAAQRYFGRILHRKYEALVKEEDFQFPEKFFFVVERVLGDNNISPGLKSYLLALPNFQSLSSQIRDLNPEYLYLSREEARQALADQFFNKFEEIYNDSQLVDQYEPSSEQIGFRRLANTCLAYLSLNAGGKGLDLCLRQFKKATNMTDSMAALVCLSHVESTQRIDALSVFFERWSEEDLVMDKWLAVQASSTCGDTLARVKALKKHPSFSLSNPNKVRALMRTFASNPIHFHLESGEGYRFVADCVLELDKINPQIAARIAGVFSSWRNYEQKRRGLMEGELKRMRESADLSVDTLEIIEMSLGR